MIAGSLAKVFARSLACAWLLVAIGCATGFATGCATSTPKTSMPPLRLSPESFGREESMSQVIEVTALGKTFTAEAALEIDRAAVRLALVGFGRTVARLDWDGVNLKVQTQPGWPDALKGERILDDLQLMYWPLDEIRKVLPAEWSVAQTESAHSASPDSSTRDLFYRGNLIARVTRNSAQESVLENYSDKYRLLVRTTTSEGAP